MLGFSEQRMRFLHLAQSNYFSYTLTSPIYFCPIVIFKNRTQCDFFANTHSARKLDTMVPVCNIHNFCFLLAQCLNFWVLFEQLDLQIKSLHQCNAFARGVDPFLVPPREKTRKALSQGDKTLLQSIKLCI